MHARVQLALRDLPCPCHSLQSRERPGRGRVGEWREEHKMRRDELERGDLNGGLGGLLRFGGASRSVLLLAAEVRVEECVLALHSDEVSACVEVVPRLVVEFLFKCALRTRQVREILRRLLPRVATHAPLIRTKG